jgi:hypothetical protein
VSILMTRLCKDLYSAEASTDRCRTRAMLCQVYHLAIYDQWFQARDLLLMSHLQDSIAHADAPTQVCVCVCVCVCVWMWMYAFFMYWLCLSRAVCYVF